MFDVVCCHKFSQSSVIFSLISSVRAFHMHLKSKNNEFKDEKRFRSKNKGEQKTHMLYPPGPCEETFVRHPLTHLPIVEFKISYCVKS